MTLTLITLALISTTPKEKTFNIINNGINSGVGRISIINNIYYINISDTGNLMWYPVLDTKNNIIDFANCIRLKPDSKNVSIIGGLSPNGARITTPGVKLNSSPTIDKIPLKEVANLLGYNININQSNNSIVFTRFSKQKISNSYLRGCLQIGVPISN